MDFVVINSKTPRKPARADWCLPGACFAMMILFPFQLDFPRVPTDESELRMVQGAPTAVEVPVGRSSSTEFTVERIRIIYEPKNIAKVEDVRSILNLGVPVRAWIPSQSESNLPRGFARLYKLTVNDVPFVTYAESRQERAQ